MGLVDVFGKEDRVEVTFSAFYELMKGCAERDFLAKGIKCNVPHRYMREMVTGNSEVESAGNETAEDTSGDERGRSIEP